MKTKTSRYDNITELSVKECRNIMGGGGPVKTYIRCVTATLTSGGGGIRTMLLGAGLFGLARALGVAVGCANL